MKLHIRSPEGSWDVQKNSPGRTLSTEFSLKTTDLGYSGNLRWHSVVSVVVRLNLAITLKSLVSAIASFDHIVTLDRKPLSSQILSATTTSCIYHSPAFMLLGDTCRGLCMNLLTSLSFWSLSSQVYFKPNRIVQQSRVRPQDYSRRYRLSDICCA